MNHDTRTNRVETRRRLLKGALAASSVMSMGAGATAVTSISCVAKVRTDGGYPTAIFELHPTAPPPYSAKWGWRHVDVRLYVTSPGSDSTFDGFTINGVESVVYSTTTPATAVSGASLYGDQTDYPKDGWVLARFDEHGIVDPRYPPLDVGEGSTPAAESCATSVNPNPGGLSGITFGG